MARFARFSHSRQLPDCADTTHNADDSEAIATAWCRFHEKWRIAGATDCGTVACSKRGTADSGVQGTTLPKMRTSHAPPVQPENRRIVLGMHRLRGRLPRHSPNVAPRHRRGTIGLVDFVDLVAPRHRRGTIGLVDLVDLVGLVAPAPPARHDWLGRFGRLGRLGRFFRRSTKSTTDQANHSRQPTALLEGRHAACARSGADGYTRNERMLRTKMPEERLRSSPS